MIQIIQLKGTDRRLYELVAPLVMNPDVLKQNYNYPFRTSEDFVWFVAVEKRKVIGFIPVEEKKKECIINNYYVEDNNESTLKLLLEKVISNTTAGKELTSVTFMDFAKWLHEKKDGVRACFLIGIRTQESFNRWRSIHLNRKYQMYHNYRWTSKIGNDIFNAYPIYDWKTTDIWTANGKFGFDYNHLYDLYYKAGVNIERQRVASPFLCEAQESLKLYRVIDPNTWGRMIGRVNGVNFTGIYGGTRAMGWQTVRLPEGYTWKSFMQFLLSTLPEETRRNYLKKLTVSIEFWRTKGGVWLTRPSRS